MRTSIIVLIAAMGMAAASLPAHAATAAKAIDITPAAAKSKVAAPDTAKPAKKKRKRGSKKATVDASATASK